MNALKMTDSELYKLGIEVLTTKLGKVGVSRFLTINMHAPCTGDYTNERHEWLDKIDKETAVKKSKKIKKNTKPDKELTIRYLQQKSRPLVMESPR